MLHHKINFIRAINAASTFPFMQENPLLCGDYNSCLQSQGQITAQSKFHATNLGTFAPRTRVARHTIPYCDSSKLPNTYYSAVKSSNRSHTWSTRNHCCCDNLQPDRFPWAPVLVQGSTPLNPQSWVLTTERCGCVSPVFWFTRSNNNVYRNADDDGTCRGFASRWISSSVWSLRWRSTKPEQTNFIDA